MVSREEKDLRKKINAGKFNVHITLFEKDGTEAGINSRTWLHNGPFLMLDLFDGTLRCINLMEYKGFQVEGIDPDVLAEIQDRN